MVKIGTSVTVLDNSGARTVKCFALKSQKNSRASSFIGNVVKGSVKKYTPEKKVTKKEKLNVLIVLHSKKVNYKNGFYQKNEMIGGVAIKDNNSLVGSRIKTPISRLFTKKKLKKNWRRLRSVAKGYV